MELSLSFPERPPRVLFLGAHADDIEIGCFGALDLLKRRDEPFQVRWVVVSGRGPRGEEARRSAAALLDGRPGETTVHVGELEDAYFPAHWEQAKRWIAGVTADFEPDLVFTHHREDRHQDHRVVAEVTWNLFRSCLILEYEVPKYDGELGQPNAFVAMTRELVRQKTEHLATHFPSQAVKPWFDVATFSGLARLRGVESGVPSGFAEAFHLRKAVLGTGGWD